MIRSQIRKVKQKNLLFYIHRSQKILERSFKISRALWQTIPKLEKAILIFLLVVIFVSGFVAVRGSARGERVAKVGGTHIEGVVGVPKAPNPLFAWGNQADSDLVKLIFSGLVKQGSGREFLPDLALTWQVEEGGKVYLVALKDNIFWHDGQPFTADDVVFTVSLIQSQDFRGVGAQEWRNVRLEKVNDHLLKFILPNSNAFFLRQLTLGILPQHLLEGTPLEDLSSLQDFNLRPIGTGPYQLEGKLDREQVTLTLFDRFYDQKPYIERIIFRFVPTEKSLASLYQSRLITGAGFQSVDIMGSLDNLQNAHRIERPLPQYKAIFFNPESNPLLQDKAVRLALASSIDRERIIRGVEASHAELINSPIPPGFVGHQPELSGYDFNIERAAAELKNAGFRDIDKDGFLERDNQRLKITLTYQDEEKAQGAASIISEGWRTIGAEVLLKAVPQEQFVQAVVRPRDYEALLFGQDLGSDPDPYLYWHSSQTQDPGLNLSLFYDKDIDNNLELARTETRENYLIRYYHNFQKYFSQLIPAVLLYQPTYLYLLDTKIKGAKEDLHISSPSDRFSTLSDWYIKTKRS